MVSSPARLSLFDHFMAIRLREIQAEVNRLWEGETTSADDLDPEHINASLTYFAECIGDMRAELDDLQELKARDGA